MQMFLLSKLLDFLSTERDTLVKNDLHICTFAFFSQVATKEMKKKKQKHRLKEIEKRSSEKEMDMMEAYTDKPVQEQVISYFLAHDVISCTCNLFRPFIFYSMGEPHLLKFPRVIQAWVRALGVF